MGVRSNTIRGDTVREQFRGWEPKGIIRCKYKDGSGQVSVWVKDQSELLDNIQSIVNSYMAQGITLTNRQLYYQLVAAAIIPNADEVYKRICKFLTDARYGGFIDWDSIEDRGRTPVKHAEWNDVNDLINSAVSSYRLPRWSDQEFYIELFCEKEAMGSILKPVADKFHIYFGTNKGYSSAATMYELAQRIKEQIIKGKMCQVLYMGDHDPSGLDMVRDINDRIGEFLTNGDNPVSLDFEVIHLALKIEQVKHFNPPSNPAKITDPRAAWYIKQYGRVSWELDALKPEVLIKLAEQGIMNCLNVKKYNAWIKREKEEIQKLKDFAKKI